MWHTLPANQGKFHFSGWHLAQIYCSHTHWEAHIKITYLVWHNDIMHVFMIYTLISLRGMRRNVQIWKIAVNVKRPKVNPYRKLCPQWQGVGRTPWPRRWPLKPSCCRLRDRQPARMPAQDSTLGPAPRCLHHCQVAKMQMGASLAGPERKITERSDTFYGMSHCMCKRCFTVLQSKKKLFI